jgi:hypothetical protein
MRYGGVSATATFIIDERGDLVDMTAERYAAVGARFVLRPWSTPIGAYGVFAGVRVPVAGEGVWRLETGDFAYIRARVTALEYNRPARWSARPAARRVGGWPRPRTGGRDHGREARCGSG